MGEKEMNEELNPKWRNAMTIFLLVVLGAMIGWVYEMLFYRIDQGHFIRRGQGGPWLPIYGFGALGLTLVSYRKKLNPWLVFLITVAGSFVIEFSTGWILYHCFDGKRLWDYNVEIWNFGNIGGYVCLRSVLVFGILGVSYVKWIVPAAFAWTKKLKKRTLLWIMIPIAFLFFSDILLSYVILPIVKK